MKTCSKFDWTVDRLPKFLSSKEASKKLIEFKDLWYGLTQKCEALSEHESGLEEPFKGSLEEINNSLKKCRRFLGELEPSLKHLMPSKKEEIGDLASGVKASLEEFNKDVELQLDEVKMFMRTSGDLSKLVKKLGSIEEEYREAEAKTSKVCTKYVERRNDYNQAKEKITGATQGKLKGVKEEFFEKLEPIVEGHELTFKGRPIELDDLFVQLLEKPTDAEMVDLSPRSASMGFFDVITGKKTEMNKDARIAVLRYVSEEIIGVTKPIMGHEAQEISRLDAQYADLRALEVECKKTEKRMEELSKPRSEIKDEISRLRDRGAFALGDYDTILELRGKYLNVFDEISEKVMILLKGAEELLEGYIEIEPDVEKRELKIQIKELRAVIEELELGRRRLEEHLKEEKERSRNSDKVISHHREKLKGMRSQIKVLEEEIDSIIKG